MDPSTIMTPEEYERTLAIVDELMGREIAAESEEITRLEQLAQSVEKYENVHFPIESPSPSEAKRLRWQQGEA